MTQVKSIRFDSTGADEDFVQITLDNGNVHQLSTNQRGDAASVLQDNENGEFDDLDTYYFAQTEEEVADWNTKHPNAVELLG